MSALFNRNTLGFATYDFSNSAYILVFNTFLFPIFFRETLFHGSADADFWWGVALSCAIGISLLLSPFIGNRADSLGRKRLLRYTVFVTATGSLLLAVVPLTSPLLYTLLFIVTDAAYIVSITLYDSMLSHVSSDENRASVSGFAWGLGYMGGVINLLIVLGVSPHLADYPRAGFLITAVYYALFSLVALRLLPDDKTKAQAMPLRTVWKALVHGKVVTLLVALWFINEAIAVIINYTGLYGKVTLGLATMTIGYLLIALHVLAFPGTWLMGHLAGRYGERRIINITLILWVVILGGLAMASTLHHLILILLVTAFVFGSSQALMRSYYSRALPPEVSGFSFGLYALVSRVASLVGMPLFGFVSATTGSQRLAMITVIIPIAIGAWLFNRESARIR